MTFAEPAAREALWKRLQAYEFDKPGTVFTFAKRLARENDWSPEYAAHAVEEYKRFVFLCMCEPPATPSFHVDQVWHLHLTFTRSYWGDFCGSVLTKPLHHDPTMGGAREHERYWQQYTATLRAYEAHFGTPPEDIWPPPSLRFDRDLKYRWVNPEHYWLVPKPAVVRTCISRSQRALQLAICGTVFFFCASNVVSTSHSSAVHAGPRPIVLRIRNVNGGAKARVCRNTAAAASTAINTRRWRGTGIKESLRTAAAQFLESKRICAGSGAMVAAIAMACSLQTASAVEDSYTFAASVGVRNAFLGFLSGRQFLMLYIVVACASHFVAKCVVEYLRHTGLHAPHESNMDPYEVAMLRASAAGESARTDTLRICLLVLVQRGWLEARGDKVIATADGQEKLNKYDVRIGSLEKAVISSCSGSRTLENLRKDPPVDESLKEIAKQLVGKGLLMSSGASTRLKTLSCLPGFGVIFLFGLPRILGANGRPVGFLVLLMILNGLCTFSSFKSAAPSQFATKSGLEVLANYQSSHEQLKGNVQHGTSDQEAAMAFAIFGIAAVSSGTLLQTQIQPLLAERSSSGGDGGTYSGGCGSCGGGCGGGCGGCGG